MPNPQDLQTGQIYTEQTIGEPSASDQEKVKEVPGSVNTDPLVYQQYQVVVQTRPYRFETDGWDYTKSQATITVNRRPGQIVP